MSESTKNQDIRPSLSFPAFQGEAASRKAGRKSLMLYPDCHGEALSKERVNAGLLITADPLQVRGGWSGKQNSAPQSESWHRSQSGKLHQKT